MLNSELNVIPRPYKDLKKKAENPLQLEKWEEKMHLKQSYTFYMYLSEFMLKRSSQSRFRGVYSSQIPQIK